MGWLTELLGKLWPRPPAPPSTSLNPDATFDGLAWLEADESPFGRRVLDCRQIAETFQSASQSLDAIRFFGSPESKSGEHLVGRHPDSPIRIRCELTYPLDMPLPEGPIFLARAMEEKWNIYHFCSSLYFARSWTGDLNYVASLAPSPTELRVTEVEAWPGNVLGDDQMAVEQIDFLIRSHLFGQVVPHPAPALPSKKAIAMWSFSQYGKRGLFAAVKDAEA
jgi:hypothetical protein